MSTTVKHEYKSLKEFLEYTEAIGVKLDKNQVHEIVVSNKWGHELASLEHEIRRQKAPTFSADKVTNEQIRQINFVKVLMSLCTNSCINCGYYATVYNFHYCPLCGKKAVDRRKL